MDELDANFMEFLDVQLPIFEDGYARKRIPLGERPLRASIEIVEFCIVEIKNENKEDYTEKAWFKWLFQCVLDWYKNKYGEAMQGNTSSERFAKGIILIYGMPFELSFPLTLIQPKIPGETFWLHWPNEVLPEEDVLRYIVKGPNFTTMQPDTKCEVIKTVSDIITKTRTIVTNLITADFAKQNIKQMADSVVAHIGKAIDDILPDSQSSLGIAYWEMQMAIEKVLKVFICHNLDINPPHTHDLQRLVNAACTELGFIKEKLLTSFPPAKQVVGLRYGAPEDLTIENAISTYHALLEIAFDVSALLKRRIHMNNTRILIKKPSWLPD